MTTDEFDRTIAGWLDAEARSGAPVLGIEHVLDETRRRRPRPRWLATAGSRWVGLPRDADAGLETHPPARPALRWPVVVVVVALTLVLAAMAALVGTTSPVPAAHGGKLAYIQGGAVFLADHDGRNPVRVSTAPAGAESCDNVFMEGRMWAPDGRHMAFRSGWGKDCDMEVHLFDADGNPTAAFPSGVGWLVDWAPDGSRLVSWGTKEGAMEIRQADGALVSTLLVPSDFCICGDRDPTWAPGGTALLVKDLLIPLDGSVPRIMRAGVGDLQVAVRNPSVSADGSQFAFVAGGSLFVVPVDDPRGGRLVANDPRFSKPVLSPSGDRIAILTSHDQTYDSDGNVVSAVEDLQIVDVATSHVTTLRTMQQGPAHLVLWPIQFSADGERLLFRQVDAAGMQSLWTIDRDGSDARLLVNDATWGDWQPETP